MALDRDAGIAAAGVTYRRLLMSDLAGMLGEQGFEVREPDDPDSGRLVITSAPKGSCEIDVCESGLVACDYFLWAGGNADPADVTRAVLRLLAVPLAALADGHLDPRPGVSLKGVVGCAARARGLEAELRVSVDDVDFSVYADVEITNPEQPGRGTVLVTDEGSIWWEFNVDELTGHAREFVMTLTDMLVPSVSPAAGRGGQCRVNGARTATVTGSRGSMRLRLRPALK
jgi:hypothetical protein